MQQVSLEIKYKNKLFYYMQIVKFFVAAIICIISFFIIPSTIYNFYIPYITLSIVVTSLVGLSLYKTIDKSLKYTSFITSGMEFLIILIAIYISKFSYNTLFFWIPAFITLTYFFTNVKFSLIQVFVTFLFIVTWPWAFYNESEIIKSTIASNYSPSFYLSTGGFVVFLFTIFHFSEKIKNLYAKAITNAFGQIRVESSFPVNNPNPIFEYNIVEKLLPRNLHGREFVLTATNIEIERLSQYSLDTMNSKTPKKVRCMLGSNHYLVNLVPIEEKVNIYLTNITDLIHAQVEIEKKEQYNRAVIDAIPGFVSWIDSDLNYIGVNKNLCEFFNTVEEEFIGNKVGSVHSHKDTTILDLAYKLFNNANIDSISEEIKYDFEGEVFWNYITLKKYNDSRNAVLVSVDVTDLKKAQEQIIQEQKKAEASAKLAAFGEMSAGIAHEINNPLSIIKGTVHRITKLKSKGTLSDTKHDELIEKCNYGIDRVSNIINGMLNLSRDGHDDDFEFAYVKSIIQDSLVLLSKKCELNNIKLSISKYDENLRLNCQRVQLSQVLVILINNSIDAIKELQNKWINIEIKNDDKNLIISIIDSGNGIDSSLEDKVFKPFFTTKNVGKGTGLGLSLAVRIIEAHRGEFSIDKESINTKFDISIPLN
jgi:PAS domain S-box-containing protein